MMNFIEDRSGFKVIIVKDKPLVLKSVESKFVKEGFQTVCCNSIKAASAEIESARFDILITGMNFGNEGGNGLNIIRKFKEKNYNASIILIVDIQEFDENLIEAFNLGADDCVFSPVKLHELHLRTLLSLRKKDTSFVRSMRRSYKSF
jgi:DNA-binding response OmpR family regulator